MVSSGPIVSAGPVVSEGPAVSSYALPAGLSHERAALRASYGSLPGEPCALAGATMGATWSARLSLPYPLSADAVRAAIQGALDEVVAQMSNWEAGSDISRYNRAAAGWVDLPAQLLEVLDYGLWLADATDGAYDPTIGPLVQAWGFGPHAGAVAPGDGPAPAESPERPASPELHAVEATRARCGWRRVRRRGAQAWQAGGTELDFSSIAKGYGVDRAAQTLDRLGVTDYLMEAGGELRARGQRPDGRPWRVAVESPDGGAQAASLPLLDCAIATSGDYRRYMEHGGRRYAHTLDPRTGRPVDNGVASVTVVHAGCIQADALATALTVLGEADGMRFAQQHGLAALFIMRTQQGLSSRATPAMARLPGLSSLPGSSGSPGPAGPAGPTGLGGSAGKSE